MHHEAEPNLWVRAMFHFLQIHTIQFEYLALFLLDMHERQGVESNKNATKQEIKEFFEPKVNNGWVCDTYTHAYITEHKCAKRVGIKGMLSYPACVYMTVFVLYLFGPGKSACFTCCGIPTTKK